MAELMLGYNIFEDSVSENTIRNILEMEIPNFSEIRQDVDESLNDILHLALQRPRRNAIKQPSKCLPNWKDLFTAMGMVQPMKNWPPMPMTYLAGTGNRQPIVGNAKKPSYLA